MTRERAQGGDGRRCLEHERVRTERRSGFAPVSHSAEVCGEARSGEKGGSRSRARLGGGGERRRGDLALLAHPPALVDTSACSTPPRHSSHPPTHHGRLCSRGCQVSPRPLLPPPPPRLFAPEMGPPSPRHASPPIATARTRKSASPRLGRATQQPSSGLVATCSATSELTLSSPPLLFVPPPPATGPKPPPLRRPPRPAASRTRRRLSSSPSASSPPPPPTRAGPETAVGQQVADPLSVSLCAQLGPGCRVRPSLAAFPRANRR